MSDNDRGEPNPDSAPDPDAHPDSPPLQREGDPRPDIEQAVAARSDAVGRGEGGPEPSTFTDTGQHDGVGGTGGVTRSQDLDQQ